ncbi:MAG: DUF1343 domain-containing protein, partial [bacterium]|nr:DUF1343 domain-containing protein [bacterium]
GVGYTSPFELIGAPWIEGEKLAQELNRRNLPGVFFRPTHFRPFYFLFVKEECSGVQIHILDHETFEPVKVQLHILTAIHQLYPDRKIFDTNRAVSFDRAFGTDAVRKAILNGDSAETIIERWNIQIREFEPIRKKYLLY